MRSIPRIPDHVPRRMERVSGFCCNRRRNSMLSMVDVSIKMIDILMTNNTLLTSNMPAVHEPKLCLHQSIHLYPSIASIHSPIPIYCINPFTYTHLLHQSIHLYPSIASIHSPIPIYCINPSTFSIYAPQPTWSTQQETALHSHPPRPRSGRSLH